MLMDRGFQWVRPLVGGLEAWRAAGYAVESDEVASESALERENAGGAEATEPDIDR